MISKDYVHYQPNFLTESEVDHLNYLAAGVQPIQSSVGYSVVDPDPDALNRVQNGRSDETIRESELRWLDEQTFMEQAPNLIEKIFNGICGNAYEHLQIAYKVAVTEAFQHTTYNACSDRGNGFYRWHQDVSDSPVVSYMTTGGIGQSFIRKISASIQLSDPMEYEGGNFQWCEVSKALDTMSGIRPTIDLSNHIYTLPESAKSKGSLVLFPSTLHHQVTPIVSGTRRSLVVWLGGEHFV